MTNYEKSGEVKGFLQIKGILILKFKILKVEKKLTN